MSSDTIPLMSTPERGFELFGEHGSASYFEELSPQMVIDSIREMHASDEPLCDGVIDKILGLQRHKVERYIQELHNRGKQYPGEQIWLGGSDIIWTPYDIIRNMVNALELSADDVLCDLGSGYGRVALYTAITTPAKVKGVELVAERERVASAARNRLGLDNLEFIAGNVLDQDYSDVTVFYAYHPFSEETFSRVGAMLQELANQKPITIVSRRDTFFGHQRWLAPTEYVYPGPFSIFKSIPPATA